MLDTHIWLWYLIGAAKLPVPLRGVIDTAHSLWLSPVSVWELSVLVDRGRFEIDGPLRSWVAEAFQSCPMREASMTREVALTAAELHLHRDPADRFLVASALVYNLEFATLDSRLLGIPNLTTRSS